MRATNGVCTQLDYYATMSGVHNKVNKQLAS